MPPWPSEKFKHDGGVEINGLSEEDKQWFCPFGVRLIDGKLLSSSGVGILGVINGHGSSIGEAFARAYKIVGELKVQDLQYRTDLAEQCHKDYRELRRFVTKDDSEGWIGVDLDGTLAEYHKWSDEIGKPIPKMVSRVRRWLYEGKEVRILTARGSCGSLTERTEQLVKIHEWVKEHIGEPLEVTDRKDVDMIRLYDDRAVQVEANEGNLINA